MEQQGCLICLAADPLPLITHSFSCGCSVLVHKRCLVEWFSKSETTCLYCRKPIEKPIQTDPPTPTQVLPISESIYIEVPSIITRPIAHYPYPRLPPRLADSMRSIYEPLNLCKFALICVCISVVIGGVFVGTTFIHK